MRYCKMYMHPDWWYLWVSPADAAPNLGDSWQVHQFRDEDLARKFIKDADLTEDHFLFQGKEVLQMFKQFLDAEEDAVTEPK